MEDGSANLKVLSRDAVKYIAMLTMLLNHIAHMFLASGTLLKELFEYIGYFTAPTMCYFLVEGYFYTRSKRKYGQRLLLFAIISQLPYSMALRFPNLNMIFTLFCCFLILVARDKIQNQSLCVAVSILLVFVTGFSDWAFFAAIYTIMFANNRNDRKGTMASYGIAYAMFALLNIIQFLYTGSMEADEVAGVVLVKYTPLQAVFHGLLSGMAILVSAAVVLVFYNGKRAERGRNFSKWFFYLFYPGHLLVLWLVRLLLQTAGLGA